MSFFHSSASRANESVHCPPGWDGNSSWVGILMATVMKERVAFVVNGTVDKKPERFLFSKFGPFTTYRWQMGCFGGCGIGHALLSHQVNKLIKLKQNEDNAIAIFNLSLVACWAIRVV